MKSQNQPSPDGPLLLKVVSSENNQDQLQRVVLTGTGLERLNGYSAGAHIKLFFKRPKQTELSLPQKTEKGITWPPAEKKPFARTYSIRSYDPKRNELTVDFVIHEPAGVAAEWAMNAKAGDVVGFAGPGPKSLFLSGMDHYLLVGDLSSLPAIQSILDQLPSNANIDVIFESTFAVLPKLDEASSKARWHKVDQTFDPSNHILPAVKAMYKADRSTSVMVAGEHATVVGLRDWFRHQVAPQYLYAVPYWKHTEDEETYHAQRHQVMDG